MWTWVPAFCWRVGMAARDPVLGATDACRSAPSPRAGSGASGVDSQPTASGRGALVNLAMAVSGAVLLCVGLVFGARLWLLAVVAWIWGFFVVADSAQFSALVTEVAPPALPSAPR